MSGGAAPRHGASAAGAERAQALEAAPYFSRLGARVVAVGDGVAEVSALYRDVHSNTLGVVHGGISASLALWSAELAAWSSQHRAEAAGPESPALEGRCLSVHVSYLAAAREEGLSASARVLARGRHVVHVGIGVRAEDGRDVAAAAVVFRIGGPSPQDLAAAPVRLSPLPLQTEGGAHFTVSPYIRSAGIDVLRDDREGALLRLPLAGNQGPDGRIDAGAVLGCIDTCAALACRPNLTRVPSRSSTLSLSVALAPLPDEDLLMVGSLSFRDGEAYAARVEAARAGSRECIADASVLYRFA